MAFAMATVIQPELLLLDEFLMDPLMKQTIWGYLQTIARSGQTTVLFATHNVEEIQNAVPMLNSVGVILNGTIVAENAPADLACIFGNSSFDDAYYNLCVLSEAQSSRESIGWQSFGNTEKEIDVVRDTNIGCLRNKLNKIFTCQSLRNLKVISVNSSLQLFRRPRFFVIQLLLPLFAILSTLIIFEDKMYRMGLSVVNEDDGLFSELLLPYIDPTAIHQHPYSTNEEAVEAVRNRETFGVIRFSQNCSSDLIDAFTLGDVFSFDDTRETPITLSLDYTNPVVAKSIMYEMQLAFETLGVKMADKFGLNRLLSGSPIKRESPVYGPSVPKVRDTLIPGLSLCLFYCCTMITIVLKLISDKTSGHFDLMKIAGVTPFEMLLGICLPYILLVIIQGLTLQYLIIYVFGSTCLGSFYLACLIEILQGLCGLSVGLTLGALFDNSGAAVVFGLGFTMTSIILSGIGWPLEGLPPYLQVITSALPQTLSVESLLSVMCRGWSLAHSAVTAGIYFSVCWIIVFGLIGIFLFGMPS